MSLARDAVSFGTFFEYHAILRVGHSQDSNGCTSWVMLWNECRPVNRGLFNETISTVWSYYVSNIMRQYLCFVKLDINKKVIKLVSDYFKCKGRGFLFGVILCNKYWQKSRTLLSFRINLKLLIFLYYCPYIEHFCKDVSSVYE